MAKTVEINPTVVANITRYKISNIKIRFIRPVKSRIKLGLLFSETETSNVVSHHDEVFSEDENATSIVFPRQEEGFLEWSIKMDENATSSGSQRQGEGFLESFIMKTVNATSSGFPHQEEGSSDSFIETEQNETANGGVVGVIVAVIVVVIFVVIVAIAVALVATNKKKKAYQLSEVSESEKEQQVPKG